MESMVKIYIGLLIIAITIYSAKKLYTDFRDIYRAVKREGKETLSNYSQREMPLGTKKKKMHTYENPCIHDDDY